ncbi:MAG TPA: YheU family protein [Steroidobacteraceae bacterium]|nr:YheU family protein [Steroidobacteraceae bacterium]
METEQPQPIVIPHRELSAEALRGVLESFVLREGTDYGDREVSLEQKVAQVLRQLERGEAQIIFDATVESVDIVVSKPSR